eukprot:COSAG01_NODE_73068_length_251_cov_0.684211_1_plen_48_part_10
MGLPSPPKSLCGHHQNEQGAELDALRVCVERATNQTTFDGGLAVAGAL